MTDKFLNNNSYEGTDCLNLESIRSEIDVLDREISLLLQKRLDLVCRVADYKKRTNTKILDENREQKVLENVVSVVGNKEYSECVRLTFEGIMAQARDFQKKRLSKTQPDIQRFALIGEHLSHSLSPHIHNLYFKKSGIKATYELMEVPKNKLEELFIYLSDKGYLGVNVTIPYKTEVMRMVDSLSNEALRVGAVNTVRIGASMVGTNTDYTGFGMALEYFGFKTESKTCAVLGSGGASRAVVSYLEDHGAASVVIVTRDTDATSLKYPGLHSIDIGEFNANGYDLIINTTPVGMFPKVGVSPLTLDQLKGAGSIMDLIYNPSETLILSYAKQLGIPCANGLFMLVAQALCAQEIWQNKKIDLNTIHEIYEEINKL